MEQRIEKPSNMNIQHCSLAFPTTVFDMKLRVMKSRGEHFFSECLTSEKEKPYQCIFTFKISNGKFHTGNQRKAYEWDGNLSELDRAPEHTENSVMAQHW